MSTYTMTGIICDNCGTYGDPMGANAAGVRQMAAAQGWDREGRKDLCPLCA